MKKLRKVVHIPISLLRMVKRSLSVVSVVDFNSVSLEIAAVTSSGAVGDVGVTVLISSSEGEVMIGIFVSGQCTIGT